MRRFMIGMAIGLGIVCAIALMCAGGWVVLQIAAYLEKYLGVWSVLLPLAVFTILAAGIIYAIVGPREG